MIALEMITLAKAFEWSVYLQGLLNQASAMLLNRSVITETKEEHMRSKAYSDAEDETIVKDKPYIFEDGKGSVIPVSSIIDFYLDVENEFIKLTEAINKAKCNVKATADFDALVAVNKTKRSVANTLAAMAGTKSSEKKTVGYGNKFNENGDQVKYAYDIKQVTTIDFDRNEVRKLLSKYRKETDEVSELIDNLKLTTLVAYSPIYELKESFEDALVRFCDRDK